MKQKITARFLAIALILSLLCSNTPPEVSARSIYDDYSLYLKNRNITLYLNGDPKILTLTTPHYVLNHSDKAYSKASEKIEKNLKWTTSNPSVVQFVTGHKQGNSGENNYKTSATVTKGSNYYTNLNNVLLIGLSTGTATIKVKSSLLKKTLSCKITVKKSELTCQDDFFYANNNYTFFMAGDDTATSFSSSNTKVASINSTSGLLKAKKAGTTTISCIGESGKEYTYKISVKKPGLNYKKLTNYYYTGMRKDVYSPFPLVAYGIDVKKWKSSNTKICKLKKYGSVCLMKMKNTGKCTITCIAKDGKKYKCKLTVTGGKIWGGLNGGYRPTLSTLKKHGYYNDINKINDYGKVVVAIYEYDKEVKLKNGNKRIDYEDDVNSKQLLADRYPNSTIHYASGGDHLLFTNDKKTKSGRLWISCYYVD